MPKKFMTPSQITDAVNLMREHIEVVEAAPIVDDGKLMPAIVRYKDNWSDQRIADQVGIERSIICSLRARAFGVFRRLKDDEPKPSSEPSAAPGNSEEMYAAIMNLTRKVEEVAGELHLLREKHASMFEMVDGNNTLLERILELHESDHPTLGRMSDRTINMNDTLNRIERAVDRMVDTMTADQQPGVIQPRTISYVATRG